jgi:hypothetical protein
MQASKQIYKDSEWMKQGNCHPDWVDNNVTEYFIYDSREAWERHPEKVQRAMDYCGTCVVRDQCLEYGLRINKDCYAIYGGMIISPKRKIIT